MKAVNVFYLGKPRIGGWVSFLSHFTRALPLAGLTPTVYCVGRTTEVNPKNGALRPRKLGQDVTYYNVSEATACELAAYGVSIVTSCAKEYVDLLPKLAARGPVHLRVTDGSEIRWLAPTLKAGQGVKVHTTRTAVAAALAAAGVSQVPTMPTPYIREVTAPSAGKRFAVAFSRVDWDKNTHVIVEANRLLPPGKHVEIHGAVNRMYEHHKIVEVDPAWRRFYGGEFRSRGYGAHLAAQSKFSVDLSVIAGEMGGGRQFTFLEAWDGGSALVVHSRWADPAGPVAAGKTALVAGSAAELVDVLTKTPHSACQELRERSYAVLEQQFNPQAAADSYAALLAA